MAREQSHPTDEAGTGPEPRLSRHLMPLREARHFRVAKGEPDIRGWSVFSSNGREVGRVGDLLVDTSIGEVVMFDVNRGDTGDQTIAPIRAAWIDRANKRVILDSAHLAPISELPALGRTTVPPPLDAPVTPVTPADEEVARQRRREAHDIVSGERERSGDDELIVERRHADVDEAAPLPDAPRIERRNTDEHPDTLR